MVDLDFQSRRRTENARVRLVQATDRDQWLELWSAWQRHMGGQVPPDVTEKTWLAFLEQDSGLTCLVAAKDNVLFGFACLSITPFAWTASHVVFLQDFLRPFA